MKITSLDALFRYTTRLGVYRFNVFKTGVIVVLVFVILSQLFSTSIGGYKRKEIVVMKPGEVYNSNYDKMVEKTKVDDLPYHQRCQTFFESLDDSEFSSLKSIQQNLKNKKILPKWKDELAQLREKALEKNEPLSDKKINDLEKEFNSKHSGDKVIFRKVHEYFSNVRIFGSCYIERNIFEEVTGSKKSYNLFWDSEAQNDMSPNFFLRSNEIEIRLFPWLTKILPTYKHGSEVLGAGLPVIDPGTASDQDYNEKSTILYNMKHRVNGQGIVIPIFDDFDLKIFKNTIKVLRFIGLKLPIQIVHYGAIDEYQEQIILRMFEENVDQSEILNTDFTKGLPVGYNSEFSTPDIYFANIKLSVSEALWENGDRRLFKLFALLFSSFKHVLLLDPLIVPTAKIQDILDSEKYEKSGSYFFKSFDLDQKLTAGEISFFRDLFPTELDLHIFDAKVGPEASHSRFFESQKVPTINSDVLAIDKGKHFLGIILSITLSLFPFDYSSGEVKNEFLWLGPFLAGAGDLAFHDVPAAVLGDVTQEPNHRIKDSVSSEVCSSHIGYLDDLSNTSSVIFLTNGLTNCIEYESVTDLAKEAEKPLYRSLGKDTGKLTKWFKEKSTFKYAMIPPQENAPETKIDEVTVGITNQERYCEGNIWCGYNIVGAKKDPKYHGDLIELSGSEVAALDTLAQLWKTD